jgi:RNA polymerase sigma-70 factor (ECF subfamily)
MVPKGREAVALLQETESLESASDSRLVEQVRQGVRAAYGELVRRYEKKLVRTIQRMVGHAETAEDLAQDTFLKAYDRLDRFDSSKRFGPWLFQIGVNTAIDWMRRNKKRIRVSLDEMARGEGGGYDPPDPDPRGSIDLSQEVQHVLNQIPIDYRTVLMLRDLEGFPCSEVAAIIGRQEPTVRWRLLRAREMFKEIWERRQGEPA